MKLLRYDHPGRSGQAGSDDDGQIRDLSTHVRDITPDCLDPGSHRRRSSQRVPGAWRWPLLLVDRSNKIVRF
jgi:hypothetical protein